MRTNLAKKPKIYVGKNGGVRVDAKEFFAQPEVQTRLEKMKEMNIVGMKLEMKDAPPNKDLRKQKIKK